MSGDEQIRALPHREKMRLLHGGASRASADRAPIAAREPRLSADRVPVEKTIIRVVRKASVKGIYLVAPFDHPGDIQGAFAALSRIARSHDWITPGTGMSGILSPHQRNTYKAFLPVSSRFPGTDTFPFVEVEGGQYATFSVRGDLRQTNKAVHYFYHRWLPESGFKIAGVTGFETFSGNPAITPYYELERQIHIPIEPAV